MKRWHRISAVAGKCRGGRSYDYRAKPNTGERFQCYICIRYQGRTCNPILNQVHNEGAGQRFCTAGLHSGYSTELHVDLIFLILHYIPSSNGDKGAKHWHVLNVNFCVNSALPYG